MLQLGEKAIRISGKGCVSAAGLHVDQTRRELFAPTVVPQLPPPELGSSLPLPCFLCRALPASTGTTRSLQLLEMAIREALSEANLSETALASRRVGVCIGTTVGCQLNDLDFHRQQRNGTQTHHAPHQFQHNSPAAWVKRRYALTGPASCISNACASSADAIALGALYLQNGLCDLVLAGGMDELNQVPLAGFHALGVANREHCRPFDRRRQGLNLGEGAGIVVLETAESARKRGGTTDLFLAGAAAAVDAHHITAPHGRGLKQAMTNALLQAGIQPPELAFINAHGTGTLNNDLCETMVFAEICGSRTPFLSTKGITGHTLGGAGVLEFIFTLLMLEAGRVPASYRFEEADPQLPLRPLTAEIALDGRNLYALSTSLAFGGCNTALIAGRE